MSDNVFDLDAVAKDLTEEPFRFRFGGEDYEIRGRIDLRWLAALEADRLDDCLHILLGEEQYARMRRSPAIFDRAQFDALCGAYAMHLGTTLGESAASTGS